MDSDELESFGTQTRLLVLCIVIAIACACGQAEVTEHYIAERAAAFHQWHLDITSPGQFIPSIESNLLARFLMMSAYEDRTESSLTYTDALRIASRIRSEYGYRFSNPPISEAIFKDATEAAAESRHPLSKVTLSHQAAAFEAKMDEALRRIVTGVRIPETRINLTPTLNDFSWQGKAKLADGLTRPLATRVEVRLNRPVTDMAGVRLALELLATTSEGRQTLARLLPKLRRGEVQIAPMTPAVRDEYSWPGASIPAAFCVTSSKGPTVIYIDFESEIGVFADILSHEAWHAVDFELVERRTAIDNLLRAEMDIYDYEASRLGVESMYLRYDQVSAQADRRMQIIQRRRQEMKNADRFLRERSAFDSQHRFRSQLTHLFPESAAYFESHIQKQNISPETTDQFISKHYGTQFRFGATRLPIPTAGATAATKGGHDEFCAFWYGKLMQGTQLVGYKARPGS